eukprot:CAMPEP_0198137338 /NCGR_PEP_ID=MMETSP1443-20131203/855_1 /TAXON_ID=186043 /ORGANISM="Entomoneis sp., Strain CCMP2396" /LENGTH=346 /DNA_ID=CAMNT_0043798741 /DNA_START=15 /DNA_END=1055 /DNA_ORIENTATION=+
MAYVWRVASRTSLPVAAAFATSQLSNGNSRSSRCDSSPYLAPSVDASVPLIGTDATTAKQGAVKKAGFQSDAKGSFKDLFPLRQKFEPKFEYPLWDHNWDDQMPPSTGSDEEDRRRMRNIRKSGVTRHIILVRHGQYDETHKEDGLRTLTPLGRLQAERTGQRLAEMIKGSSDGKSKSCNVKVLRVSGMTRAIETADIISSYLPGVEYAKPDPILNEGRPCHHIPGGKVSEKTVKLTDENHPRIEEAFDKFFHRAEPPSDNDEDDSDETEKHEFEIIVCHANVIRYFMCRALQIPPEAWLRYCPFNCSLTYMTIRSTGSVSCRMVGDTGHLPYDATSFSQHQGFVW